MNNNQTVARYFTTRLYAKVEVTRKLDLRYELDTVLDKLNKEVEAEIEA